MKQKSSQTENKLLFKFFISGMVGMIAMAVVLFIFHKVGWSKNPSTGIFFLPWLIGGALIIPVAYRQGFKDGKNKIANQHMDFTVKTPVD